MPTDCIPFRETGYFSPLICDYLDEKEGLQPFYHRFPKLENFKAQIEEKGTAFPAENRSILVEALQQQYNGIDMSEAAQENLISLSSKNTFTITTGHQLNLFTGPLYFLYKIISTINLTKQLKEAYPAQDFVPVYWMATEDHDFEEINYFNFNGKKVQWNRTSNGAVGELKNDGLEEVLTCFKDQLGPGKDADYLANLFEEAYVKHEDLTKATRYLANALFGEYGLVIVDGNDTSLKALFKPYVKQELTEQRSFSEVTRTAENLRSISSAYKIQVNPREINLFYLVEGLRERIVLEDEQYKINDTNIVFSKEALLQELEDHPERFSPNVILRPLYQEAILPNLCYIGGGGELAYWLELKAYFDAVSLPFPMLLLRNSAVIIAEKQLAKLSKLNISVNDLFLKRKDLVDKKVHEISEIKIDLSDQRTHLQEQFKAMHEIAEKTDKSFLGAVKAQEVKQLKGLDNLEKRLLKAQKRKLSDHVQRITDIQEQLFPNQSLQERNTNFSNLYLVHGASLIPTLFKRLHPLDGNFSVISI